MMLVTTVVARNNTPIIILNTWAAPYSELKTTTIKVKQPSAIKVLIKCSLFQSHQFRRVLYISFILMFASIVD